MIDDGIIYFITDTAFYIKVNLANVSLYWISWVLVTLMVLKVLLHQEIKLITCEGDERYLFYGIKFNYAEFR
ncbi:MAG: hypothetical protein AMR96_05290 [Candidatus Adiutrix intracellularis]|nr:MAG: hypothetical protein AMR96_05290 [Candidatus Adiutrix intracellularis]